jgi:hypothetical protein
MLKIQNHHHALTQYINASLGLPFQWGERDCATYGIGAIEAMLGQEVNKPDFSYANEAEALEFAKTWTLEAGMLGQLKAYEIQRNFHQPGDIAIVRRDGFECVHVVFDRRAYAPLLDDTVRAFSMTKLYEECPDLKILRFD